MSLTIIALGILPSLIWLSIYLREDEHPEPNRLILKIFFMGALSAPLAAGLEFLLIGATKNISLPGLAVNFLVFFVFIGLVEEYWKYLAVRMGMFKNPDFDEPTDAMIYLIVAALGFAAVENILALFNFTQGAALGPALEIVTLRFLSATLLHVLASAILGYYLARQYFFQEKGKLLNGLIIAALLHGVYNTLTIASESFQKINETLLVILLLGLMAVWVNFLFYRLKKDFFR